MNTVGWPGHNDMRPIDWPRLWALIRSVRKTGTGTLDKSLASNDNARLTIVTAIKGALNASQS